MKTKEKSFKKIPHAFVDRAKRHPFKFCMVDNTGIQFRYIHLLASILLTRKILLKKLFKRTRNERVGILFPSSCISALVNLTVLFMGKTPINLNPKTNRQRLLAVAKEAGIKRIITSRIFLETLRIQDIDEMVFLEDFDREATTALKIRYFMMALLFPGFLIKTLFLKGREDDVEDEATIIFSGTKTSIGSGIILSHKNIMASAEATREVLQMKSSDCVFGAIPFIQAMGFTTCLCLPLVSGYRVVYHASPLKADEAGSLIRSHKATIFFGIPILFSLYVRKCYQEDLESLKCAVAGTEELRQNVTKDFFKKFDVLPFLSYGQAEVSGILMIGVPSFLEEKNLEYKGQNFPRFGLPFPGMQVKVVSPDTLEEVPYEEQGILLVKGPTVMKGYLNQPDKTEKVILEGWYNTHDIVHMDDGGYIHVQDRFYRFSHISGEKIPHGEVEEEILDALSATEQVCVVTAVTDPEGFEKLVVLYERDINIDNLFEKLVQRGNIPSSWIPKEGCYFEVPEIPFLDSGKPDLIKIKEKARLMDQVHIAGEKYVEVTIETEDGNLIALNHFRRGNEKVVILAHGWRNSKDTYLFKKMCGMFSLDYDVLCLDFRGHGRSSGRFAWSAEEDKDLRAVVAYAKRNDYKKIAVMGFSLGGATTIIEGSRNHDIDSIIAVSAPTEFRKIDFHFWEPEILNDIRLIIGPKGRGRDVRPGNPFKEKIKPIEVVDRISPTPILFIHGERDWLIKPYHSEELYRKAKQPKRIVIIKDAGHADKIYDTSSPEFEKACYDWLEETLK